MTNDLEKRVATLEQALHVYGMTIDIILTVLEQQRDTIKDLKRINPHKVSMN